ncbi:hypothetical protein PRIPAC_86612 [Pristionchus pacificus]|uniref:Uncharacterized protein n=1 Tax=Pristionchus pacificus TaxID=54126 RepID=A0A2A6BMU8_PRIPA|nr:hypothetical protein PRIPAC_86612 [Pristionchus pacificus]|eukprot:PDM67292.1 hypothetical protein PRIPAC_48709 [Pristionchus pacificus]
MNFSEQIAILPSLILDASKNFSSPIFTTLYSVVDHVYNEKEATSAEVLQTFEELSTFTTRKRRHSQKFFNHHVYDEKEATSAEVIQTFDELVC